MRVSSVLWKGFIRRGRKSGLGFPRGVKGREGFLSTGTGGSKRPEFFALGNFGWARLRKKQSFRVFSHTEPRDRKEMPQK